MYIRRYFVPLTISHHPVFVYQTFCFVEGHVQSEDIHKKKKLSTYISYVHSTKGVDLTHLFVQILTHL